MTVDELKERLNDEFQDIYKSILINGDWGIGKTYFLENDFLKEKTYIKISLFGLNSIEEVKTEIYAQLNKVLDFLKHKIINKLSGNSINLLGGVASVSIPYWETDIKKAIERKCKKSKLIVVIDDVERKSSNINMEDVLGMIESFSKIDNINIIIIANEKMIEDKEKNIYENFKEKVVQKVYNVNRYSKNAPKEIIQNLLTNLKISKERCEILRDTVLEVFMQHRINNLRTLEKGCCFIKLIIKHIDLNELYDNEFKDLIIASLAVVIEEIEKLYTLQEIQKREEQKKKAQKDTYNSFMQAMIEEKGTVLEYCVVKNYFKEQFFVSNKTAIVNLILNIYRDIDVESSFQKINKIYKDFHKIENKEEEKHLFYLAEDDVKNRINKFYENYVLRFDESLDINNWFKKLNEVYSFSSIVDMENIFKDDKIFKAMDLYLENLDVDKGLFELLDRHILYDIEDEKMKYYNKELNKKIVEKYYSKCLEVVKSQINNGKYDWNKLDALFTIFAEDRIDFNKQDIINQLKENSFFIPELNYEIEESRWAFTHSIWKKMKSYKAYRDNSFEENIKEILKDATIIGKHRIEALNKQYGINLNEEE